MPPATFLERVLTGKLRAAHVRPLQNGSLLAVRLKAADVTAAVRFRGRIWNPPLHAVVRSFLRRGAFHMRPKTAHTFPQGIPPRDVLFFVLPRTAPSYTGSVR